MSATGKALGGAGRTVDDRFGGGKWGITVMRKAFPDHWSFLLGEIAMYSFVVLLLTGIFLTFFFKPGMTVVPYEGSYTKLNGVHMSEAYASTLRLSFDVRGGLLVRQIHHWSAVLFIGAILIHMLRHFFTGSYRKPREISWLIGMVLMILAFAEGFAGYSLPDDLLSGTGLRIFAGTVAAIPIVGSYLLTFLFGSEFPGEDFITRLYIVHVLLIPGILAALIPLHAVILTWRLKHTQFPGHRRRERNVVGYPFFPVFIAKTTAFLLAVSGVTILLASTFQINPVWLFGPYNPSEITAGSQPDWYLGFLEGALRIMPSAELTVLGHTLTLSVAIPALVVPGILFGGLALYPFLEKWLLNDYRYHHTLDRPRNAPFRTGLGAAGIAFYGILWAAGGNDIISTTFQVDLFATTWFFRGAIIIGPVLAYIVAYRICIGLQRRDSELASHGLEIGQIKMGPDGRFTEATRPLQETERAVVFSKKPMPRVTIDETDGNGVAAPEQRRPLTRAVTKLRVRLNEAYHKGGVPTLNGHDDDEPDPRLAGQVTSGNSSGRRELNPPDDA
ncbi:MAG TPA: ubiquinol-cytochrome c reductase cytochrome b subunit [Streptosporangiaceae bacterium]|nr:ubiquinol-cytochrome c reductase cytochrome b subunit [Streptosporangiaceae bacterium]